MQATDAERVALCGWRSIGRGIRDAEAALGAARRSLATGQERGRPLTAERRAEHRRDATELPDWIETLRIEQGRLFLAAGALIPPLDRGEAL